MGCVQSSILYQGEARVTQRYESGRNPSKSKEAIQSILAAETPPTASYVCELTTADLLNSGVSKSADVPLKMTNSPLKAFAPLAQQGKPGSPTNIEHL